MHKESYLQTITAAGQKRDDGLTAPRAKQHARVQLKRKPRAARTKRAVKAFALLLVVCAVYAAVFALTHNGGDPTPNISEQPRGIANFFKKY